MEAKQKKTSKEEESNGEKVSEDSTEQLIYSTASFCPRCVLLEQKGLDLLPSKVFEKEKKIWLQTDCTSHGIHRTLYCSNAEFFRKTLSYNFNLDSPSSANSGLPDLEDLKKKAKFSPSNQNLPLVMELPLWENDGFIENTELAKRVAHIKALFPPNRQFVLKVLGKLAADIHVLNEKVKYVESLIAGSTLILEASYERLCLLCELEDSVFLRPSVFPSLKYYLREGDEERCKNELLNLFQYLKSFSGIQLMVTFCVSKPFPNLQQILSFVRQEIGFIRLIVISMERSPKTMIDSLKERKPFVKESHYNYSSKEFEPLETIDIYELLEAIEAASGISPEDFFPLSMAAAMEPFLNIMGYGHYYIRPSPFCGYATCLVNTKKSFVSYPVTRLFDFYKLFSDLRPILPRLQDGKIGIYNANKLHKIFLACKQPNKGPLPDLYTYFTDKSKAEKTRKFIQHTQFLVVHNNMDISAFDLMRRCNCVIGSASASGLHSYCTGCI